MGLVDMDTFVLDVRNIFELSDGQFYQLCRQHPDIRFERSAKGELIIMPPMGGISGNRNFSWHPMSLGSSSIAGML